MINNSFTGTKKVHLFNITMDQVNWVTLEQCLKNLNMTNGKLHVIKLGDISEMNTTSIDFDLDIPVIVSRCGSDIYIIMF